MAITNPEWSRITNTTMHDFVKGSEENILRNRKILAKLKAEGRIEYDCSGDLLDWKIKYRLLPMQPIGDQVALTYARADQWKTAQLDWRGYAATNSITDKEKLMNRGNQAIVKLISEMIPGLTQSFEETFGDEVYVDGFAAGNELKLCGIESFMGNSGASPTGFVGVPSDTYAGISTVLGNYGGAWNGSWPSGTGSPEYDFFSPIIVDYTDLSWTPTVKTWPNTCKEAMRYGIMKGQRNSSKEGQLNFISLENQLFMDFKNALSGEERLNVQRGDDATGMYALGFRDVINWDGVDIGFEYGIPNGVGYGWAFGKVNLCSMNKTLLNPRGPDFNPANFSDEYSVSFYGNMKFNPRYFVKFMSIT